VGLGRVLVEPNGLAILGDGVVQLALLLQHNPEIVVGRDTVLLDSDGLVILGDGLV
jgi:hypothetical protein